MSTSEESIEPYTDYWIPPSNCSTLLHKPQHLVRQIFDTLPAVGRFTERILQYIVAGRRRGWNPSAESIRRYGFKKRIESRNDPPSIHLGFTLVWESDSPSFLFHSK